MSVEITIPFQDTDFADGYYEQRSPATSPAPLSFGERSVPWPADVQIQSGIARGFGQILSERTWWWIMTTSTRPAGKSLLESATQLLQTCLGALQSAARRGCERWKSDERQPQKWPDQVDPNPVRAGQRHADQSASMSQMKARAHSKEAYRGGRQRGAYLGHRVR